MSTSLYLPSTASAPPISPTPSTGWDVTSGFDRLMMSPTKASTSMADKTIAMTAGSSGDTTLFRQYIYGPLAPVTVGANVTWTLYVRGLEPSTAMNAFPATGIWIATSSGTLRGTIRAGGSTGGGSEYTTSLSSRQHHPASYSNSSISVQAGDYLVLELGMIKNSTSTGNAVLNFGDNSASDLAANNITTADNPVFVIATDFVLLAGGSRSYIIW